ncbi:MAG TPA: hypothetical protein VNK04_09725 [Gemmataceae bacterium]|jgi:hypothetical protein|nr:hypothetical protein [Gemmataceae bacterium]
MKDDVCRQILGLLRRLDEAKIAHRLNRCRDDAIMIEVDVPGERWEIEFVDYDDEVHVEIERFRSNGKIYDESILEKLFAEYSADSPAATPEQVRQESEAFFRS